MLGLQSLAYWDIYKLEHNEIHFYGGWANHRLEKGLRLLIVVCLLLGMGELVHAFRQTPFVGDWISSHLEPLEDPDRVFVVGGFLVFSLLFVWNGVALLHSRKYRDLPKGMYRQLLSFLGLSLLAAIFWPLYYVKFKYINDVALAICVMYFFLLCVFLSARGRLDVYYGKERIQWLWDRIRRMGGYRSLPPRREFTDNWRNRIVEIYERMTLISNHSAGCDGLQISVLPNVYAPCFFKDSKWFAWEVSKIVGNHSLLEIGTGTGIIAIYCARNGARVVATDINPAAVENAQFNAKNYHLGIDVRLGDVFDPIPKEEKYDFIFWAHPFNNLPIPRSNSVPLSDMLMRSGFDESYKGLTKYIANARDHLTERGRLLLGSGDSADLNMIAEIAETNGYAIKILTDTFMPLAEWGDERIRYMILEFINK